MIFLSSLKLISCKVLFEIKVAVLALLRIVLMPILLLLLAPIYIWRRVVIFLQPILRPDLSKIVAARSMLMAVDDPTNNPRCNLCIPIGLRGRIDLENFVAEIEVKLLEKKSVDGSSDLHPEMKQYYEQWLGFTFWKYEKSFNSRDHIKYYDSQNPYLPVTTEQLTLIETELSFKEFEKCKSPWEALYVPNYIPDNQEIVTGEGFSLIIFRLHHGIADGYSIINLLVRDVCQLHDHKISQPNYRSLNSFQKCMQNLKFCTLSIYEQIRAETEASDKNIWTYKMKELSNKWFQERLRPINVVRLKEVRNYFRVSFTAMLIGGISGGIKTYISKNNLNFSENFHCMLPFPMPGHTKKLRNFFSFSYVKFPIVEMDDSRRFEEIEENLKSIKNSTLILTNFLYIPFIGGLTNAMIKSLNKYLVGTGIMSNFPGPLNEVNFMSLPVIEMGYTGGLLRGNHAFGASLLSYNGQLTIRIGGNSKLFSERKNILELAREIEAEFSRLIEIATI